MWMFVALMNIWAGFKKGPVLWVFVCLRMCIHCGFSSYDHKDAACSRDKPVFHLVLQFHCMPTWISWNGVEVDCCLRPGNYQSKLTNTVSEITLSFTIHWSGLFYIIYIWETKKHGAMQKHRAGCVPNKSRWQSPYEGVLLSNIATCTLLKNSVQSKYDHWLFYNSF